MEIPILYYNYDGTQVFEANVLRRIFEKIGSRHFVTLSFNGMRNGGKSFMLRRLVRYLSQLSGGREEDLDICEWVTDSSRPTALVGIDIWSDPIILQRKDGSEVAVILMRTQGTLDSPATIEQNSVTFALSLILSSFFILNVRKGLSKESLSFLQYYLTLAKSFIPENAECRTNSITAPVFQRILFLIRDIELRAKDFAHGLHTPTTKPPPTAHSQTNLFTQLFNLDPTRQPLEIQHTYRTVLSSFESLGLFALPEPKVRLQPTNQTHDLEFQNYVQTFLDMFSFPEGLPILDNVKRVNTMEVSGYEYLQVVEQLEFAMSARSVRMAGISFHEGRIEARAEMFNVISKSNLISLYISTILEFMLEQRRKTGKPGMYSKILAEKMNSFLKICLDTFSRRLSQGDEDLRAKYRESLSDEIEEKMKLFESLNECRIKYERQMILMSAQENSLTDQLSGLRLQLAQAERDEADEIWEAESELDAEIDRRLRHSHRLHLIKQIEDRQLKLNRLHQNNNQANAQNEKNLEQIVKIIQNISNF